MTVDRLTKRFRDFVAVDELNFTLARGEVLGLLGANGAGKTTAMSMLLGLTTPTSGRITIFGEDLQKKRLAILQRCNFSSAYTSLPGNLLVWQNLLVFAKIYGVPNPRKKIDELLELMEIQALRKSVTGELSAGEAAPRRADGQPGPRHCRQGAQVHPQAPERKEHLHPLYLAQHEGH